MDINRQTYEEYFLLYTDGELSVDEKIAVENFVSDNPDLRHEFLLMQQTVFTPDENEVFENKESLYRREERRIVPFPWFRLAAAAVLICMFSVIGWVFLSNKKDATTVEKVASARPAPGKQQSLQTVEPSVSTVNTDSPARIADALVEKAATPATTPVLHTPRKNRQPVRPPVTEKITPAEITSPPLNNKADITETDLPKEDIAVPVAPRTLQEENDEPQVHTAVNNPVEYASNENDNTIYFANTSLPKKTKLRGVFRKASRIFDKVTSFQ